MTQSGPLRIAYGYDIPVIASDLEGFKESVEENVTGVLFKSENVESLVEVMRRAIPQTILHNIIESKSVTIRICQAKI